MNGQRERGGKEAKMNEQRDSSRLPGCRRKTRDESLAARFPTIGLRQFVFVSEEGEIVLVACETEGNILQIEMEEDAFVSTSGYSMIELLT